MKKRMFWIVLLLCLSGMLLCPCIAETEEQAADSLYVKRVDNLPEDFIFGMDASSVIARRRP